MPAVQRAVARRGADGAFANPGESMPKAFSHFSLLCACGSAFMACVLAACSGGGSGGGSGGSASTKGSALSVTTSTLPSAELGVAYSQSLTAQGGTPPYTWALVAGSLPPGLLLADSGAISGTPADTTRGVSLTVRATDSGSPAQTSSATLTLVVTSDLQITANSLPAGAVGSAYEATLSAAGGTPPYAWSLAAGTLPAGLTLDGKSGVLSGTPTAVAAAVPLTFEVSDAETPAASTSAALTLTVTPRPLTITTSSLPYAQVGVAYSATLAAQGGSGALSWALTSGTLPPGLSLNGATGAVSGTPTASVLQTPLGFTVSDSSTPPQTQKLALTLTVDAAGIAVDVSPHRAAATVGQALTFAASTNDAAGVTWSVSPAAGSFSATSSQSGVPVTFTAPATAGAYTVTATSLSDGSRSAAVVVGVTDLTGVLTYHNDLARDGANVQEYALTTANVVNATFGKLYSCAVDGAVYAQPLWAAKLSIAGVTHNVVFVATEHDSVYAFDADASPCQLLWHVSLLDAQHGASSGETTVASGVSGYQVGSGYGDITPEIGITGTPVIDPAAQILYVVAKSVDAGGTVFHQRLHALDLLSGAERAGAPANIAATYPNDSGGTVSFSTQQENQRGGLTSSGGTLYLAWGSHEDAAPWYGWVMGYSYDGSAFTQQSVLNVAPNSGEAGIWMSGGAPSVDSGGHLYVLTGNGQFDGAATSGPSDDYGDSFLQLKPGAGKQGLAVSSFFTPSDQASLYAQDGDFGSGGSALVLNLTSGSGVQHVVVGGGKDQTLYVLNGDQLGGSGDGNALQSFALAGPIFATGAFWNNTLYIAPLGQALSAYAFQPAASPPQFTPTAASASPTSYGFPGATPAVSASGTANGIVWAIDSSSYCTQNSPACRPAVLHAYDATALGTELWNSAQIGADAAGNAVKFTVPTVANGKVYIGTRGNNTGGADGSTSIPGELEVYGLKP